MASELIVVINRKLPIVDGLLVLLVGVVVAVLAFPSGPAVSHHQMVATMAADLDHAIRSSHQDWLKDSAGAQNWKGSTLQFNQGGWPIGQSNDSVSSVHDCETVWKIFLDGKATAAASPVTDYRVSRDGQTCIYSYAGDVQQSRMIQYSADTGLVQVLNP